MTTILPTKIRRYVTVFTASLVCALLGTPAAVCAGIITEDTVIDATSPYNGDSIAIRNGPNGPPNVIVLDGAQLVDIVALDESALTIVGGRMNQVVAGGSSHVDIRGGTLVTRFDVTENARLRFRGGVTGHATMSGDRTFTQRPFVTIEGGTILGGIDLYYSSDLRVRGGTMGRIGFQSPNSGSTVSISGGSIERFSAAYDAVIQYSGGELREKSMLARDNSRVDIYGHDLHYAPGGLYGTLLDGTMLDGYFVDEVRPAHINIHNVPEPMSIALAIGAIAQICVGVSGFRRRPYTGKESLPCRIQNSFRSD